ncbi:Uncharacterised protein [Providencia rustigianii]|uniref:Lipoprotein n=1 Tax=Providencia rustigianii TaxID=158850 RepID=A0A379G8J7_9GAMM|nr:MULTISPECIES: hypothetical protein [Gammaproteobacteria]MCU8040796.1 hypothetical protein [Shewanella sp. SM69]SUC37354.1 Uncharacterised protein [Providencia rustigianii]
MKKYPSLSLIALCVSLSGCVTGPRHYAQDESRALNLARAGGIYDLDLRDSHDGTHSYSKGMLVPLLDLARLTTSFDDPLRRLSGTQTFAFNATDIMMTPDNPSARPSLMGWMPASAATSESQAYEKYVHLVDQAIQHVADDMALNVTKLSNVETPEIDGHPMILWSVESAEHGCGIGQCVVAYNITTPHLWKSPLYIKDGKSESYNIAANHLKNYSRFVFRQSGPQDFPIDEFYRAVSAALPSWMVIYYPPNHVVQDGQSLPYPVLYEQGKQLLFKEPAL